MYARAKTILTLLMALVFAVPLAGAQQYGPGQGRAVFSQQQLDQMLAPIALYPDALLSQILMASTYPREVVEAARWSRRNPGLNGDRAVRAAEQADWDPSVKSLVAFPQILDMMDEKLNWTEDLGDAFLDQETQIMDTVQYLRRKAYTAGSLSSSDQYRVDLEDSSFVIRFANPEAVYLPYYNPTIVYGTWWWPAYQPVYWAPWPGYYSRAGYARGYAWGPAIPVSRGFFFGASDWRQRRVTVVNVNNYYFRPVTVNRTVEVTRNVNVAPAAAHVWQHDTAHRRDAPYRDAASRHAIARATAAPEVRYEQQHERPDFNGNRNDKHNRHDNGRRNDNDNGRGRAGNRSELGLGRPVLAAAVLRPSVFHGQQHKRSECQAPPGEPRWDLHGSCDRPAPHVRAPPDSEHVEQETTGLDKPCGNPREGRQLRTPGASWPLCSTYSRYPPA